MRITLAIVLALFIAACSSTKSITKQQYIDTMVELGCHDVADENTGDALDIFALKKVTKEGIDKFRKDTKPDEMKEIQAQIAQQVKECKEDL